MADFTYTYVAPVIIGTQGMLQRSDMPFAFIPLDLGNMDYQAFLAWVAEGNTPPDGWTGPTNPSTGP